MYLSIAFSSNKCERTFSHYSLVKTDLRNRFNVETVEHLLNIGLDRSELKDLILPIQLNTRKMPKIDYMLTS